MTLSSIFKIFSRPKKQRVLVKSKFGLPAVKVCGVVLVDAGPCTCQYQGQAALPDLKKKKPGLSSEVSPPAAPDLKNAADSQESLDYIIFKCSKQDLKKSLSELGINSFIFGKVVSDGAEHESLKILFSPENIDLLSVLNLYSLSSEDDKIIFYRDDLQKVIIEDLLYLLGVNIRISQTSSFNS